MFCYNDSLSLYVISILSVILILRRILRNLFRTCLLIEVSSQQYVTRVSWREKLLLSVSDGASICIFHNSGDAVYFICEISKLHWLKFRGFSLTVRMNADPRRDSGVGREGGCVWWGVFFRYLSNERKVGVDFKVFKFSIPCLTVQLMELKPKNINNSIIFTLTLYYINH